MPILMTPADHTPESDKEKRSEGHSGAKQRIIRMVQMVLLLFLSVLLPGLNATRVESLESDASQVKTAFVYNFIKFVQWPPEILPPEEHRITLCLLGNDSLADAVELLTGKTANGKLLFVKRITSSEDASACQVLYLAKSEENKMGNILKSMKGGVLTIGDMKNFASFGGTINFVQAKNRISFEINLDAATAAGIRISSQLLRLATIVSNNQSEKRINAEFSK